MKKLTHTQIFILCLLAAVGAALCIYTALQTSDDLVPNTSRQELILSHESGFYEDSLVLEISCEGAATIYYTLDGSNPSPDNAAAEIYTQGLPFLSGNAESIYTVRVCAYYEDGTSSEIINRTFVTGDNIMARYGIPVLFLTVDDAAFFDEEQGIMIGENKFKRGPESEEEIFMTLFDENGQQCLSQRCGFRIYGDFSRHKMQPSFRLYARSEYDVQNDFEYNFFTNQFTEENTLFSETKRIIARNAGNDNGFSFIRSELATRLCLDAGYQDTLTASPVAVYFNNTYYGPYWFVPNFDENYFRQTYGDYEGTMYKLEGSVPRMTPAEDETDEVLISLMAEYNEKLDFFTAADLTAEENWTALNDFMDVENFLQYVAIHNYTGNFDSLKNNYKIYRYVAPEDGEYTENSVFDGRYRFLLYDLDYAFAFNDDVDALSTTERINNSSEENLFFINLMKRQDCQEYYIRYTLSLQNYYFTREYASPILDEMHELRKPALHYAFQTTTLFDDNHYEADASYEDGLQREIDHLHAFFIHRKDYTTQDLSGLWGPFTTYELSLANPQAANISLDYATLNETFFCGTYYKEIPVQINATAKPGYHFDYWMINGEIYEEPSLEITEAMISGDSLSLECICSPDPDAELLITGIKPNGGNDYIQLTNVSTTDRYLNKYYLSDNDTWNKSSLPGIILKAGETITVYCKDYTGLEALGEPCVNFNLSEGETLTLYRNGETCLHTVTIPDLGTDDGVYTMNMDNGEFYELLPE